jgi:hypothetical protein
MPKPHVTREPLPTDREELHLFCEDAPNRPGNEPENGDISWALSFPLSDGRRLVLHTGPETYAHFIAMLAAAATDDAEEEMEQ